MSVSAPGKILWLGGYSVLTPGNVSFVTAVDAYVTATVSGAEGDTVLLDAPQLRLQVKAIIDRRTGRITGNVPAALILFKTAAEIAARYARGRGKQLSGFRITTKNDDAFAYSLDSGKVVKSGLGSSAAVTVATVGALLKAFGVSFEEHDALHKLAQTAHSLATGKVGSGFDIAAATFGSIFYSRYSAEILEKFPADYTNDQLLEHIQQRWDYSVEKFSLPKEFRVLFANFGEAMITTEAVGSVSEFKKRDPAGYSARIKAIDQANRQAIYALRRIKEGDRDALTQFQAAFVEGRNETKLLGVASNLGIEPDDCTDLIEESQRRGAFVVKLPGAGGKDAIAAIALDEKREATLREFWLTQRQLRLLRLKPVEHGVIMRQSAHL